MAAVASSAAVADKLRGAGLSEAAVTAFLSNYDKLLEGESGLIPEADISAATSLPRLEDLASEAATPDLLAKTVVIKLNGGLGTSMGLERAKSLLVVKDGKSFLDLIAEQVAHAAGVDFVLMNSFSTDADTRAALAKSHPALLEGARGDDLVLLQNKSPKIDAATMAPVSWPEAPDLEWCPPGHGDIYASLLGSGMLDRLLDAGKRYAFVSNSDNLGAVLSPALIAHFASSGAAFMMEVAERTEADKKGGHLAQRKGDGRLILRESAMCPDEDKASFQDVAKHRYFNTNNLYLDLAQVKAKMAENNGMLPLPLIKNKKTVNPRDSATPAVYQLETAMGSAIECFENSGAVVVPRTRFSPVKTCSDLFALRSDAYGLTPDARVELRGPAPPIIKLDDAYYKHVDKMQGLCQGSGLGVPSLIKCKRLAVEGPVAFAEGIVFEGSCKVTNAAGEPKTLEAGTYVDADLIL